MVMGSSPIVPSARPMDAIRSAFNTPDWAKNMMRQRPANIIAAYSPGPNDNTTRARSGDRKVMPRIPNVPAMKEPIAAMPRAAPARPLRAIS